MIFKGIGNSKASSLSPFNRICDFRDPCEPFTFTLPHLLLYLLVSFTFPLFPFLPTSSIFLLFHLFSHSTTIVPLSFQAGCRKRRLNLALVFVRVDFVLYAFLVKDACLFFVVFDLVLSCGVYCCLCCCSVII